MGSWLEAAIRAAFIPAYAALAILPWALFRLAQDRGKWRKWRRVARRARHGSVSAVGEGLLHLEGRAEGSRDRVQSPITDQPCLAYSLVAVKVLDRHRLGPETVTLFEEQQSVPFRLSDATGSAWIQASDRSTFELAIGAEVVHAHHSPAPEWLLQKLRAANLDTKVNARGLVEPGREIQFREGRLDPGEPCGVIGVAVGTREGAPVIGEGAEGLYLTDGSTSAVLRRLGRRWLLAVLAVAACAALWGLILVGSAVHGCLGIPPG